MATIDDAVAVIIALRDARDRVEKAQRRVDATQAALTAANLELTDAQAAFQTARANALTLIHQIP